MKRKIEIDEEYLSMIVKYYLELELLPQIGKYTYPEFDYFTMEHLEDKIEKEYWKILLPEDDVDDILNDIDDHDIYNLREDVWEFVSDELSRQVWKMISIGLIQLP